MTPTSLLLAIYLGKNIQQRNVAEQHYENILNRMIK